MADVCEAKRTASVPASFAQTRVWLHARMIDEPAAYHITERLRLKWMRRSRMF